MTGRVEERPQSSRLVLTCLVVTSLAGCGLAGVASGQNLTPRSYWPVPKGTKVAAVGYSHVRGDVLFDPSIPLYGVDTEMQTAGRGPFITRGRLCHA